MTRTEFKVSVDRANKIINAIVEEGAHFCVSHSKSGDLIFEYNSGDIAVTLTIDAYGDRTVDYWDYRTSGDIWRTIKVSTRYNYAYYIKRVF